ncbi:MAG: arylsulfatase [Verrucomicrobiales bacterium]|nr:arylsulfatase [Verrucomicrobiales bacterium]
MIRRLIFTLALSVCLSARAAERLPNFVIVFTDDQGYGDVGCFGAKGYTTPHLDRMAKEGVRFTNFHVASAVCSASRVALLTGCYNTRVSIRGALGPKSTHGIHADEMTIAELLKQKGYATAIFGKWHLGHHEQFLPTNHGFDEYFGLPYSNDMWPYHPNVRHLPMAERLKKWPHLPLIEGTKVVNPKVTPEDQRKLTTQYTDRAVSFIDRNKDKPFFLYVPHGMPHVPLYVSDKFKGRTENGTYGDVISEIDWSVGQILQALKRNGIDENTLVIFTSDNGPWLSYGNHSGTSGPLREGKGTSWEGGVRVPFIARWPGKIPAKSVISQPAMTIDLLPTIARLSGAPLPKHTIDGKNVWPLLSAKKGAKSPQKAYYIYYGNNQLQAVISGKWKLILPHRYRTMACKAGGMDGIPNRYSSATSGQELYDLRKDISEKNDVSKANPKIVKRLLALAENAYEELGDGPKKRVGKGVRPAGQLASSK